jgi:hypothetical protein
VVPCQFAYPGSFGDLVVDRMREWHHWPVFSNLRNGTARPDIREEPGRGPESINFSVIFDSIYAVKMIGVVQRVRKYKRGNYCNKKNMNAPD